MGILILSLFLNGIGLGLVYAAVAIGFSLVLGVSGVINFSHGIMYAFGAYFFWILYGNIGFWPALAITPVFVAIIGFVIERALVRRVYGLDPLFGLVITLGFATAMEEVIRMIFGPAAYSVSAPSFAKGIFLIGDFAYPQYRLFIAVMAAAMLAGVWLLIDRTHFGAVKSIPSLRRRWKNLWNPSRPRDFGKTLLAAKLTASCKLHTVITGWKH